MFIYSAVQPKPKGEKAMKKMRMAVMAAVILAAGVARADVKTLPAIPALTGESVTLTVMGEQPKEWDVIVYNDSQGTQRKLGKVLVFPLEKGESFTFTFTDQAGTHWQLIDQNTLVGLGLVVDCSNSEGCKYLRSKK